MDHLPRHASDILPWAIQRGCQPFRRFTTDGYCAGSFARVGTRDAPRLSLWLNLERDLLKQSFDEEAPAATIDDMVARHCSSVDDRLVPMGVPVVWYIQSWGDESRYATVVDVLERMQSHAFHIFVLDCEDAARRVVRPPSCRFNFVAVSYNDDDKSVQVVEWSDVRLRGNRVKFLNEAHVLGWAADQRQRQLIDECVKLRDMNSESRRLHDCAKYGGASTAHEADKGWDRVDKIVDAMGRKVSCKDSDAVIFASLNIVAEAAQLATVPPPSIREDFIYVFESMDDPAYKSTASVQLPMESCD